MAIATAIQTTALFNIDNIIGVDVGDGYPNYSLAGSTATGTALFYPEMAVNPPFALGTTVKGTNGSKFMLCVVASVGSINQYDCVAIDQNYNVQQVSSAIGAPSVGAWMVGFNQNAGISLSAPSTSYNYCWIAVAGNGLKVNTNAAVTLASGENLYVGTAAGTLGTASASTILIGGANNAASVTAATTMSLMAVQPFFTLTTGLGS